MNTFTDRDMREQVIATLNGEESLFDVAAIVSELQATYGTVPLDQIPSVPYWNIIRTSRRS